MLLCGSFGGVVMSQFLRREVEDMGVVMSQFWGGRLGMRIVLGQF